MAVLIVFHDVSKEDRFQFSQALSGIHRFSAAMGCQLETQPGTSHHMPAMAGLLVALLFPGEMEKKMDWNQGWPRAYLSAMGLGLDPNPSLTWACLALSHLHLDRDQLLFRHAPEPWYNNPGVDRLIAAIRLPFAEMGWQLHNPVQGQVFLTTNHNCRVDVAPFEKINGQSLHNVLPQGRGTEALVQLLTTGQLVLAREEANRNRTAQGLPPMNTPWIHGIGRGVDFFCTDHKKIPGNYWFDSPEFSGLARQAGCVALTWKTKRDSVTMDDRDELARLAENIAQSATKGPVLVGFSITGINHLQDLNRDFIAPLLDHLANARQGLMVWAKEEFGPSRKTGAETVYCGLSRPRQLLAKRRFWHRHSWGRDKNLSMAKIRELWLS